MTILLLFDFSKALDTISPGRLLRVMGGMGFLRAVLCWISSYINGRRLKVISKSEGESDWLYTNLDVPQGSVQHFFYADDLQIYLRVSIKQLESRVAALTRVANWVYEWAGAAALKLNASKTKAMICGSKDFVDRIPHDLPRIEVSGIFVPLVETAETLGVTLDSKFT